MFKEIYMICRIKKKYINIHKVYNADLKKMSYHSIQGPMNSVKMIQHNLI